MNIFGDPFAQAGAALAKGGQPQGGSSTGGYPGALNEKQHGRFMAWQQGQHDHENGLWDRYEAFATGAQASENQNRLDVVAETSRQDRLGMSHATRNANKLNPGTSVTHGNFSASRQHEPQPAP